MLAKLWMSLFQLLKKESLFLLKFSLQFHCLQLRYFVESCVDVFVLWLRVATVHTFIGFSEFLWLKGEFFLLQIVAFYLSDKLLILSCEMKRVESIKDCVVFFLFASFFRWSQRGYTSNWLFHTKIMDSFPNKNYHCYIEFFTFSQVLVIWRILIFIVFDTTAIISSSPFAWWAITTNECVCLLLHC